MHDRKGKQIPLGDKVVICSGISGVVVFSIDTNECSPAFPKDGST